MDNLGSLRFEVLADNKGTFAQMINEFRKIQRESEGAERSTSSFRRQVLSTALGFIGANGINQALGTAINLTKGLVGEQIKFATNMREVSTLVNTQVVSMGRLSEGVSGLAQKYGMGRDGLAKALYQTISAGIDAGKAVKFLDDATELAIAGVTDAKTSVDALTSVLNAYGMTAEKAQAVSDSLFTTVRLGKTTLAELSPVVGRIAPIASAVGVQIDELDSALATLTLTGLSTAEAGTGIRGMLNAVLKPSEQATKFAKELGIEFSVAAIKAKGFSEWLKDVMVKTGGTTEAMSLLFTDVEGLNAALQLTGDSGFAKFTSNMDEMGKKTGAAQEAAAKMKDTLSHEWGVAIENIKLTGSTIGVYIEGTLKRALHLWNSMQKQTPDGKLNSRDLATLQNTPEEDLTSEDIDRLLTHWRKARDEMFAGTEGRVIPDKDKWTAVADARIAELTRLQGLKEMYAEQDRKRDEERSRVEAERLAAIEKEKKANEDRAKALAAAAKDKEKSDEVAKANAAVLQRVEADRLKNGEALLSIESARVEENYRFKREVADATHALEQRTYQNQIANLEAVTMDEKRSGEVRMGEVKRLFALKREMHTKDREYQLQAAKDTYEAERRAILAVTKQLEQRSQEVEVWYQKSAEEVKKSQVSNKDVVLQSLEEQRDAMQTALAETEADTAGHLQAVEQKYRATSEQIKADWSGKVTQDLRATVQASARIATDDKAKISGQIVEIFDESLPNIANALSMVIRAFNGEAGVLAKDIAAQVSSAGAQIGGVWGTAVQIFGEAFQVGWDIAAALDEQFDITGAKSARIRAEWDATAQAAASAARSVHQSMMDWMKAQGLGDLSNFSYNELKDLDVQTTRKRAEAISAITGREMSQADLSAFSGLSMADTQKYLSKDYWYQYTQDKGVGWSGVGNAIKYAKEQGDVPDTLASALLNLHGIEGLWEDSGVSTQIARGIYEYATGGQLAQRGRDIRSAINNYDISDIRNPEDASTWSNADTFLSSQSKREGWTDAQYKAARWKLAQKFWQEIAPNDYATIKADYDQSLIAPSSAPAQPAQNLPYVELGTGGITRGPTRAMIGEAGEQEAVIPLSQLPQVLMATQGQSAAIGDMRISVLVDPNIPLTTDSGRQMGRTLGESVVSYFRAKGI